MKAIEKYIKELTTKGGKTTFERYGRDYMSQLGKKASAVRWAKVREITNGDPSKNCPICKYDHNLATQDTRHLIANRHKRYILRQKR